ncbi:UMP kinase [Candidatus Peregrinibacteria bacterium]|nr:UMP kinase [Candidatus Peregrinibacteria bacterium]
MSPSTVRYKRVLLKLSGEVLQGKRQSGIDTEYVEQLCKEIKEVHDLGVQIGIVVGGGNIWRYRDFKQSGIERIMSDNMGMMATVMNGSAMKSAFEKLGLETRVVSALRVQQVAEDYYPPRALHHLQQNRIVICVGGTGNPYFTTDSAAALRALELNCDILLKATKVDGVYNADPEKDSKARMFDKISYKDVLTQDLKVMDLAAVALCKDDNMPILVFNLFKKGNIKKAVLGEKLGTLVS